MSEKSVILNNRSEQVAEFSLFLVPKVGALLGIGGNIEQLRTLCIVEDKAIIIPEDAEPFMVPMAQIVRVKRYTDAMRINSPKQRGSLKLLRKRIIAAMLMSVQYIH